MAEQTSVTVRGTYSALELIATPGHGRMQTVTLGVVRPRRTTEQQAFRQLAELARDVRRFAVDVGASEVSTNLAGVRPVELRALIWNELAMMGRK